MQYLPLSNGQNALVDDDDFSKVVHLKWFGRTFYRTTYAVTQINRKTIGLHRFILSPAKGFDVDHIDGDGLNNQKSNLRICSHMENMANQKKHKDSKANFKGIWRASHCDRWGAQLAHKGKKIYLGLFQDPIDAATAYDKKAKEVFGKYAKLNFPEAV